MSEGKNIPNKLGQGDGVSRARNHTVLLNPDLVDQLRSGSDDEFDTDPGTEVRDLPKGGFVGKDAKVSFDKEPEVEVEDDGFAKPKGQQGPSMIKKTGEAANDWYGGVTAKPADKQGVAETAAVAKPVTPTNSAIRPPVLKPSQAMPNVGVQSQQTAASAPSKPGMQNIQPAVETEIPQVTNKVTKQTQSQQTEFKGNIMKQETGELKYVGAPSKVIGFLVSYQKVPTGEYFPLCTGRMTITADADCKGSVFILADESVSMPHAIAKITEGEIMILDQLSEQGTKVKKKGSDQFIELAGERTTLQQGDQIWFGDVHFYVSLVEGK